MLCFGKKYFSLGYYPIDLGAKNNPFIKATIINLLVPIKLFGCKSKSPNLKE